MFRDEEGLLSKVIINSSDLIIDGQKYQVPELESAVVDMDSGPFNMYGGVGSSGLVHITLPAIPKKEIEFIVKGEAINIQKQKQSISIFVKSEIVTESQVIPLFKYFYWKLTST